MQKSMLSLFLAVAVSCLLTSGCLNPVKGSLALRPGKTFVLNTVSGPSRNVASGDAHLMLRSWSTRDAVVRLTDANGESFDLQFQRTPGIQAEGPVVLLPRDVDQRVGFQGIYVEQELSRRVVEGLFVCTGFGRCERGGQSGFHFDCEGLQNRRVTTLTKKTSFSGSFTRSSGSVVEPVADITAESEPYEEQDAGLALGRCRVIW